MSDGFTKTAIKGFPCYICTNIATPHLFTTREGGVSRGHLESLNLGFSLGDERQNVIENYKRVASCFDAHISDFALTCQVHSDNISIVGDDDKGKGITKTQTWQSDALITDRENIILGAFCADCVVILLHDSVKRVIATVHSGWKGTALNIVGKTVDAMKESFKSEPSDIHAAIGHSIGKCCFETDNDVYSALLEGNPWAEQFIEKRGEKYFPELKHICKTQLLNCGCSDIEVSPICTYCSSSEFWSHRKTKGVRGVGGGFICL